MASRVDEEFCTYVVDLMQLVAPVSARRMFGGYGVFVDGLMVALIHQRTLYLKVDAQTRGVFEEQGMEPFFYTRQGKRVTLSFYQAPEILFEESDLLRYWFNLAFGAALRASATKR